MLHTAILCQIEAPVMSQSDTVQLVHQCQGFCVHWKVQGKRIAFHWKREPTLLYAKSLENCQKRTRTRACDGSQKLGQPVFCITERDDALELRKSMASIDFVPPQYRVERIEVAIPVHKLSLRLALCVPIVEGVESTGAEAV